MSVTVLQQRIREKKTPLALGLRPELDKLSPKILKNFTDMFGPGAMADAEALRYHGTMLLDAAAEKLPAVMRLSPCRRSVRIRLPMRTLRRLQL